MIFISFIAVFFFYNAMRVRALNVDIIELPIPDELTYGAPLFESKLVGGIANVEGKFYWENELLTYDVGEHTTKVVFKPTNSEYSEVVFDIRVKYNKRRVYIKFEDDIYKHYDGTTFIDLPNYVIGGIIDKTVFVRGNLKGEFENALIGNNNVLFSGLELVGEKKDNYYLDLEPIKGTIYRIHVEKFGDEKHRVSFKGETYVPADSLLYVNKLDDKSFNKKNYSIREVYDIYLESDNKRINVNNLVEVKVKLDKKSLNHKRIRVFNYSNGVYEKVDYKYEDGYIVYQASSLGNLVIAQKKLSFWWLYLLGIVFVLIIMTIIFVKRYKGKEKINKYKSIKRRKDYEYN